MSRVEDGNQVTALVDTITELPAGPFELDHQKIFIGASVEIRLFPVEPRQSHVGDEQSKPSRPKPVHIGG